MPATRILVVDDEEMVLKMLRSMLVSRGFEVTAAVSVAAAIAEISSKEFDVLITDLNIGQPGDGFTVVSAMRRTQPEAITLILTGYPDFETALNAIKNQVDDYIVKPPDLDQLVNRIKALRERRRDVPRLHSNKRAADIIQENVGKIAENWFAMMAEVPELVRAPLREGERIDEVPKLLERLAVFLRSGKEIPKPQELPVAREHGRLRRGQGYSLEMLLEETRILQRSIFMALQRNLLSADLSALIPDMIRVSDVLQAQVRASVEGYLAS